MKLFIVASLAAANLLAPSAHALLRGKQSHPQGVLANPGLHTPSPVTGAVESASTVPAVASHVKSVESTISSETTRLSETKVAALSGGTPPPEVSGAVVTFPEEEGDFGDFDDYDDEDDEHDDDDDDDEDDELESGSTTSSIKAPSATPSALSEKIGQTDKGKTQKAAAQSMIEKEAEQSTETKTENKKDIQQSIMDMIMGASLEDSPKSIAKKRSETLAGAPFDVSPFSARGSDDSKDAMGPWTHPISMLETRYEEPKEKDSADDKEDSDIDSLDDDDDEDDEDESTVPAAAADSATRGVHPRTVGGAFTNIADMKAPKPVNQWMLDAMLPPEQYESLQNQRSRRDEVRAHEASENKSTKRDSASVSEVKKPKKDDVRKALVDYFCAQGKAMAAMLSRIYRTHDPVPQHHPGFGHGGVPSFIDLGQTAGSHLKSDSAPHKPSLHESLRAQRPQFFPFDESVVRESCEKVTAVESHLAAFYRAVTDTSVRSVDADKDAPAAAKAFLEFSSHGGLITDGTTDPETLTELFDRLRSCIADEKTGRTLLQKILERGLGDTLKTKLASDMLIFGPAYHGSGAALELDREGNTLLHLAVKSHSRDMITILQRLLMRASADPDAGKYWNLWFIAALEHKNNKGETPLQLALGENAPLTKFLKDEYRTLTKALKHEAPSTAQLKTSREHININEADVSEDS